MTVLGCLVVAGASAVAGAQVKPPPRREPVKPAAKPAKPAADTTQKAAETPPAPPKPMGKVSGVVIDSVHATYLRGAAVSLEGTTMASLTNEQGRFLIDSVPPGSYRVRVEHELLDSLGMQMLTNPVDVADQCPGNWRWRCHRAKRRPLVLRGPPGAGPSAIIGRLLDADTDQPVDSARRVSFAWSELSLQSLRRVPRRDAHGDGVFRICGLPSELEGGTLQASKAGVLTAEVRQHPEPGAG
ncbi:MAG: carboxypeptidase regulatory-like domain-containing protein [Gemmatimonadaceae bacterium]